VTIDTTDPTSSSGARNVVRARSAGESLTSLGFVNGREVFAAVSAAAVHVIRRAC
jgi:hypothetical protein